MLASHGHLDRIGEEGVPFTNQIHLGMLPRMKIHKLDDTSILKTCHELAEVGTQVLWRTSNFTFDKPKNFSRFVELLQPAQRSLIRNLRFIIDEWSVKPEWNDQGIRERSDWNFVLTTANLKAFPRLRSVHVDMCVRKETPTGQQRWFDRSYISGLAEFGKLELEVKVEVHELGEYGFGGLRTQNIKWDEKERIDYGIRVQKLMEGKLLLAPPAS